ncbi:hypothetical protein POJ06DRAFT_250596 [Lipomyces tetrasporus]|uniref:Myb-like domain-containing protein n=1 Tax=Lipomyces tetrasporus TaxID=54092 RepID=A0AAD7QWL0_9ASCO|nr:uncharacterized protein POJ06DRAFT_250596 [Lipomyces tetrasporus]KAJ8101147.1 hypothetical protein POJ06DRAFT_250596 [Lipomyces tetrasporus]
MDQAGSDHCHSIFNDDLAVTQVISYGHNSTPIESEIKEPESKVRVASLTDAVDEVDDSDDAASVASIDPTSEWNYNVNYLALLNYEIEEFMHPASHFRRAVTENDHGHLTTKGALTRRFGLTGESTANYPLKASIIESRTHWSPEEKELFFEYLGRRSRHDPVGISRGVGSKSTVECAEYIALLERGLQQLRAKERKRRLHGMRMRWRRLMRKIPAARKMSGQWIRFEESESRRLENYTEHSSRDKEAKAWLRSRAIPEEPQPLKEQLSAEIDKEERGASNDELQRISGLLDNYCADLIDRENEAHPDDVYFDGIGEKVARECQLLNVEKILELSNRFYYQQENLSASVTEYLHRHALQFSTISFFHGLVRQFTRRLVATTLTVAETRLCVSGIRMFHRTQVVHREDVESACAAVGAEVNSDRFWIAFKRRNEGLRITEPKSIREIGAEEVAKLLSIPVTRRR